MYLRGIPGGFLTSPKGHFLLQSARPPQVCPACVPLSPEMQASPRECGEFGDARCLPQASRVGSLLQAPETAG